MRARERAQLFSALAQNDGRIADIEGAIAKEFAEAFGLEVFERTIEESKAPADAVY